MNRIERTYQLRGKPVHVEELTDLAAVRTGANGTSVEGSRAFEEAGWSFVPRGEAADGAKVYRRPNGQLALGTGRVTVKVPASHSEAEARAILEKHGLRVIDRLKFAPNLFSVAAPAGTDEVEAAAKLAASGDFEFAEPEMIEALGRRGAGG